MILFYDNTENRLIFIEKKATPERWDNHWLLDDTNARKAIDKGKGDNFVTRITLKFLVPDAGGILEGGCGNGKHVSALAKKGFRVIGIDSAPSTVSVLNKNAPELDIRLGDLRNLPLKDTSMAGYWSLGVIEHYYHGYTDIAKEMVRVLKPGGYLFLTFPYMSPIRRLKAILGLYPIYHGHDEPEDFFQYALDHNKVLNQFSMMGFSICLFQPQAGLKGLKDEVRFLRVPLQKLYDYRGENIFIRGFRYFLDQVFSPLTGHSCLNVLKKR